MRWNLTAVNNNHLYLGHPKTKASDQALQRRARGKVGPGAGGLAFQSGDHTRGRG